MIPRYSMPEMEKVWSDESKFWNWAQVEIAVLRAKVKLGLLNVLIPRNLLETIKIDPAEIDRIEREETGHDVIAFLMHTSPQLPEQLRPWWHHGMTSYDTQDTALSLTLIDSVNLLWGKLTQLLDVLRKKAFEHKFTPMIGRTHGVHAEPITLGVKLANWFSELERHRDLLDETSDLIAVGKISGAVGMYTLDPKVEEVACELLGLKPVTATQIISRDFITRYLAALAIIGGTIEKICVNIRTLQRTEIREAQEYFRPKQRGSSAMPHKRNPIGSENLSGMGRVLRGYASMAMESICTWDERSLDNSGPERIYLPDASILLHYMLKRLAVIIERWIIYPEKMERNIWITKGLVFSQDVQSLLAAKSGLPREEAYGHVHRIAQQCWDDETSFFCALLNDEMISKNLEPDELIACFNLNEKLKHVDHIFRMVFGEEQDNQPT